MQLTVDLSSIGTEISFWGPLKAAWLLFLSGGWIIFVVVFICGFYYVWLVRRRNFFQAKQNYIFLAIDVPKENIQTPKAVEQIFSHLHGIHKRGTKGERFFWGYVQPAFSLELVCIDGYTQFIVRTPLKHRDLVEAAVYAQYPEAEITEVEDYTKDYLPVFPNEKFDIFGWEYALTNKEAFPIKTYPSFEHPIAKTIIDPMASLLEMLSRFKTGEQFWLQLVVAPPPDNKWRERGLSLIKKLIGKKVEGKGSLLWLPRNVFQGVSESIYASLLPPSEFGTDQAKGENRWPSLMQHLSPDERSMVEAIGMKISKLGFLTKFRVIYLAKKEVYDSSRSDTIQGAIKQFNTLDLNGFRLDKKTKTKVYYVFTKLRSRIRKRKLLRNYKLRTYLRGHTKYVLNTEELASVYHFPSSETVKAPLVKKTEAKRGEPPFSLPIQIEETPVIQKTKPREKTGVTETPENIPLA